MRRYTQCISMFISECPWVYLCAHTHIHTHKLIHTPNCEMKEILLLLRTLGSPPPLPKPLTGSRSADGALGREGCCGVLFMGTSLEFTSSREGVRPL